MSVLVNFRIDEKLKNNMDKVCKDLGLTMSAAFNMFAKNLVKSKNINFSLKKKLSSNISLANLFEELEKDDTRELDYNDVVAVSNASSITEKYYINKVGDIIMLVPKDNKWVGIRESAGKMSDDFMAERIQSTIEKRDNL